MHKKHDQFTKTGSGQNMETVVEKSVFCGACRQIADVQKSADQKLGNLSRQLQEEMQRQIVRHAAAAAASGGAAGGPAATSPAVRAWLQELDRELARQQQQQQPEPEPAFIPAVAARSAAAAGGGSDPLTAAMERQGLTRADQAKLVQGGVTTVQMFDMLVRKRAF